MKHIVIIGAGPAGLTAAYELLRRAPQQYKITLLETDAQVGGISKTVIHNGYRMDLGGHRFFSKSQEVNTFWSELLPLSTDQAPLDPETTDGVMLRRKRVSRIYFNGRFYDYPLSLKAQTIFNMGFFTTLRAGVSYLISCLHKRKENSLEDFYINRFGKVLYSLFFESYTEKLWGRHPRDISADWGAQRVKGLSLRALWKNLFIKDNNAKETSLIEEFQYPKYGPGQLWEVLAEKILALGGEIRLQSEVIGFRYEKQRLTHVQYRKDGESLLLEADAVFSSMPLKDLVAALPQAPEAPRRIAEGLPYRDFVTLALLLNKEDLLCPDPSAPSLPDCWIYVQDQGVKVGRIQLFHNWSPYLAKEADKAWIGLEFFCKENDAFWLLPEEECASLAQEELKRIGLLKKEARALDFHRERVKKAYPAYFDSYSHIGELQKYLNGFHNLYCIGRNGQHRYNNMDHSMLTAMKAVELFLEDHPDREELWSINAEKEYHESVSH